MTHLPKVELHLHLDGAARYTTIFELAKAKNIDTGASSLEELIAKCCVVKPSNLDAMLQTFYVFMPTLIGDAAAIERIAYELCEDQAANGVVYFEGRFSPHFLSNTTQQDSDTMKHKQIYTADGLLQPSQVVEAVLRGFKRGETDFKVKARAILCCIRSHSHWSRQVLELAQRYRQDGVVGIDIAGCAHGGADEVLEAELGNVEVFRDAFKLGINRTVHAGESGTAVDVKYAVDQLHAQRIGHGYRMLQDEHIYRELTSKNIHIEACPTSSVITGAVDPDYAKHPIRRFLADNVNFGLNTDDPTCFGQYMNAEVELVKQSIGFTDHQIWKCQLNAAKSSFLPENEKQELVALIAKAEPK